MRQLGQETLNGFINIDEVDLSTFLSDVRRSIYVICRGILGDPHEADDVTQEVLLCSIEKISTLRDPDKYRPWVSAIARKKSQKRRGHIYAGLLSLEHLVELGQLQLESDLHNLPEEEALIAERATIIHEAMQALPDKWRAALILEYWGGMSYAQICETLGMTLSELKGGLHRAKARLRAKLEPYYPELLAGGNGFDVLPYSRISRFINELEKEAFTNIAVLELLQDALRRVVHPKVYRCRYPGTENHGKGYLVDVTFDFGKVFILRSTDRQESRAFMNWLASRSQEDFDLVLSEGFLWPMAEEILGVTDRSSNIYYRKDRRFSPEADRFAEVRVRWYDGLENVPPSKLRALDEAGIEAFTRISELLGREGRNSGIAFVEDERGRLEAYALFGESCIEGIWDLHIIWSREKDMVGTGGPLAAAISYGSDVLLSRGLTVMDGGVDARDQERKGLLESLGFVECFQLVRGRVHKSAKSAERL